MSFPLTDGEKQILLRIAREAVEHAARGRVPPPIDEESLTANLREMGASFVTLTVHGNLRGCIGALEARQPLAEDVREHAVSAAMDDPRFPPVNGAELGRIHIEISRLTTPQELSYFTGGDLLKQLRPRVDGVILTQGFRKATFLPQVWEKIPDPQDFLEQLCHKMGVSGRAWREEEMQVFTYQVEEFHEAP